MSRSTTIEPATAPTTPPEDPKLSADDRMLLAAPRQRPAFRRVAIIGAGALLVLGLSLVTVSSIGAGSSSASAVAAFDRSPPTAATTPPTAITPPNATTPPTAAASGVVYLGNGCFWERQWAYYKVEVYPAGPFRRPAAQVSSLVGYAGGADHSRVCYHTGNPAQDYGDLGHAEAVRVTLDAANANGQLAALARDFFASFVGSPGHRSRPDAADRGTPYRSLVGLPGGMDSPLYPVFAQQNAPWGMDLKRGLGGLQDTDEPNTVWVLDSSTWHFYPGEVYHQFHCNFFQSEGMPYPDSYTVELWNAQQSSGQIQPTGCPEDQMHMPCSSRWG